MFILAFGRFVIGYVHWLNGKILCGVNHHRLTLVVAATPYWQATVAFVSGCVVGCNGWSVVSLVWFCCLC